MKKYECLYVIVPELNEEETNSVINKFNGIITANGGEVVRVDEWGKRRLAYPIDYKTEGYYVLAVFESESALPAELERNMKNDEKIMRYKVACHHE
ncbi:MAG: 30S ribosomal protein S6 [Clostridia bacterium]|nr:30S ribosomal protein S6 [Clostridia bacterium]